MKFAVNLPNFGGYARPRTMPELAVAAEEAGWDGFFVWDHIVGWQGLEVADPWTLLSAIGTATQRLVIGPMVCPLPRRRPWMVARQITSLDHLTSGRTRLGVGIGLPPETEFGTFGEPTDERTRADMLDEALEILIGLWTGEPTSFEGDHYRMQETVFAPRPIQRPHIPVWVAAMWPNRRPVRRAARWDGIVPISRDGTTLGPDLVAECVEYALSHRDRGAPPLEVVVGGPPPRDGDLRAFADAGATWYQMGPPPSGERVAETLSWISEGPPR